MKPETKKIVTALGLISFTVVMLGIALNFGSVCRWITRLIDVFMPFIIGIVFCVVFKCANELHGAKSISRKTV